MTNWYLEPFGRKVLGTVCIPPPPPSCAMVATEFWKVHSRDFPGIPVQFCAFSREKVVHIPGIFPEFWLIYISLVACINNSYATYF